MWIFCVEFEFIFESFRIAEKSDHNATEMEFFFYLRVKDVNVMLISDIRVLSPITANVNLFGAQLK